MIMSDSIKNALEYWNNPAIVSEFTGLQVPEYWTDYFTGITTPETIRVLDLGCGGGRNTYMLMSYGFDTYGCDLHLGMVSATREKVKGLIGHEEALLRIIQANMLKLPYDNSSFDVVLANGVYHNTSSVEEFEAAITETVRILKPGGVLCLNVFTDEMVDPKLIRQELPHLYITPDNLDMILLSIGRIVEIFEGNGLVIEGRLANYLSNVQTGVRSVLRGIFKKVN